MTSPARGRHRAARSPITPLTPLARAAADRMGTIARRSALVVAGSGVLVSTFGAPAGAATPSEHAKALSATGLESLTEQARVALAAAPAVTVARDAQVSVESVTAEGAVAVEVTPAPEPEPEPVAEPEPEPEAAAQAASRSAERTSAPSESEPQPEEEPVAEEEAAPAPAASSGSTIVDIAKSYLGVPYVWGGSTPAGFDCSGFTSYVYAQAGITIPRTSSGQRDAGTVVSRSQARPGDLIWSPGHIAIYAGGNMQVEAPVPGKTVRFRTIWQDNPTFLRMS